MTEHAEYEPLTIVRVDEEASSFPERPGGTYEVHLQLSRNVTRVESLAIVKEWGIVNASGAGGGGSITVRKKDDRLIVKNATIELVEKFQQHLTEAVKAGDDAGRAEFDRAQQEERDRAAHREHLRSTAEKLGW